MNQCQSTFSLENILIAVAGHLALVAVLVTGVHFAVQTQERIVMSDRVQIMELDLSQVKIDKETSLYNTKVEPFPPAPKREEKKSEPLAEQGDKPAKEIETPSMVSPEKKDTESDVPKARTVVRVNRENLNRTMTVSVVDALRVALTRCWAIDKTRPGLEDIRAVAHLTMNENGMVREVWFEDSKRAETDEIFGYVLETVRSALSVCQPFRMLPPERFEEWREIVLTFYPSNLSIN